MWNVGCGIRPTSACSHLTGTQSGVVVKTAAGCPSVFWTRAVHPSLARGLSLPSELFASIVVYKSMQYVFLRLEARTDKNAPQSTDQSVLLSFFRTLHRHPRGCIMSSDRCAMTREKGSLQKEKKTNAVVNVHPCTNTLILDPGAPNPGTRTIRSWRRAGRPIVFLTT